MRKLPFTTHQLAEYVLGFLLVMQAVQGGQMLPAVVAGALLLVAAATADGPLAGWKAVSRPHHKSVDVALVIGMLLAAVLPGTGFDPLARLMLVIVGAALGLLFARTDYREPVAKKPRARVDAESVGKTAGRMLGQGIQGYRHRGRAAGKP